MNKPSTTTKNIWANYDAKKVKEALRKSAGILKNLDRKTVLKELAAQRAQKNREF